MIKLTDRPAMTIAVDMGRKATKTNKKCSLGEKVYHGNIITLTMGFICRIQASRDY